MASKRELQEQIRKLQQEVRHIHLALRFPDLAKEEGYPAIGQIVREVGESASRDAVRDRHAAVNHRVNRLMDHLGLEEVTHPQKTVLQKRKK